jgi:uncharacterized protein Yka (UPF0111/DUF47 family)
MKNEKERKKGLVDTIFPPKYDFHRMLKEQAEETVRGVKALVDWLEEGTLDELQHLVQIEEEADEMRHSMQSILMKAFSTPFDRQDIYSISRQMDYILNSAVSTAREMKAFNVPSEKGITNMAEALLDGTMIVSKAIGMMETDKEAAEQSIPKARSCEHIIEDAYIESMKLIFGSEDPIHAMQKGEIYHHLKDAGRNLSITVDILHRIIVGLN